MLATCLTDLTDVAFKLKLNFANPNPNPISPPRPTDLREARGAEVALGLVLRRRAVVAVEGHGLVLPERQQRRAVGLTRNHFYGHN